MRETGKVPPRLLYGLHGSDNSEWPMANGWIFLFFLVWSFATSAIAEAETTEQKSRPNIIILLADDLGFGDLSSYGHPTIETPGLDRLAAEGQRWTNFYANTPICSPTRGALMTGMLPVRSGLFGAKFPVLYPGAKGGFPDENLTIAEALSGAGYDTVMLGKWHLGDKPRYYPTRHGFDRWLGVPYSNDMDWVRYNDLNAESVTEEQVEKIREEFFESRVDPDRQSSLWNVPLIESEKSGSEYVDNVIERPVTQETLTRRYTREAIELIKAQAESATPFFLYLAYSMPHAPVFASEKFEGVSLNGPYGDAVEEIDWSVNEIRRALMESGLAENTLLVFSSDNGPEYMNGRGGSAGMLRGQKKTTYEGGMRVPGIFWRPGHIEPGIVHEIGSVMDLYATALSLAGATNAMQAVDAIDISPALAGDRSPRTSLLFYSAAGGHLLGYREGVWKVSFTEDGRTLSDKAFLYNLAHDPAERTDLAEAHPDVLERLIVAARMKDEAVPRAAPIFDQ